MDIDFRFVEIEYELWALANMLETIEPAMDVLAKEHADVILGDLECAGWSHDEAEVGIALQHISEIRDYVLPRFMRGPFVVALWACFESGVNAVASQKWSEGHASIRIQDVQGRTFLDRAKLYYNKLLSFPLDEDQSRLARLSDLYLIRCALAHSNANREGMGENQWSKLKDAASRQKLEVDESRGMLVLGEEYVRSAFVDVDECLRALLARARATG